MRGVASVTSMAEQQVLDYFYTMAREPDVDRIELLKQLADVALSRPSDWDYTAVRQALAGVRTELTGERCFACFTEARRVYWHHIIQVQNGGSNHPRNLTTICARCHRAVHPWLPEPDTMENRGFSMLGDWVKRISRRLFDWAGARTREQARKRYVTLREKRLSGKREGERA
jgi:hypothetical protein